MMVRPSPPAPPRHVLITGASSGLGEYLAYAYAAPGMTLTLSGRDAVRLAAVAAACRGKGAAVRAQVLDVTAREAMATWIAAADAAMPLDLVIANAGISGGTGGEEGDPTRRIFAVNLDGVVNTVLPALAAMRPRRRGQIALMASLAGFRGQPAAPAYCASKAAVRVWGEGLRGALAAEGIGLTVVCPGFVKSRITAANRFPMPFLMETETAAALIRRGIGRGRARLSFPWPVALGAWLLAALPPAWTDPFLVRVPAKEGNQ